MIDMKIIRNETEKVKEALKNRNSKDIDIDGLLELDAERRSLLFNVEQKKAQQNSVSKQIPVYKKEGKDTTEIFAQMRELSDSIKEDDEKVRQINEKIKDIVLTIPNIPDSSVPIGKSDEQNVEIRRYSTPRKFDFEPKSHWNIGKDLDILDPETAAKITGARFHVYKNMGARLERAIINYSRQKRLQRGVHAVYGPQKEHGRNGPAA